MALRLFHCCHLLDNNYILLPTTTFTHYISHHTPTSSIFPPLPLTHPTTSPRPILAESISAIYAPFHLAGVIPTTGKNARDIPRDLPEKVRHADHYYTQRRLRGNMPPKTRATTSQLAKKRAHAKLRRIMNDDVEVTFTAVCRQSLDSTVEDGPPDLSPARTIIIPI